MAQRILAAIVITDAVGFSARAGVDEETALRELQSDFAIMRASVELRNGVVLKSTGDGLLIKFDSAWDAVDSALDIQTQFASRPDEKFKHRMGVHLCDIVLDANDAHGDGVNLAARLQEQAAPGGIILSKTILEIVKSRLSIQPISLGKVQLKNIPERTEIFQIGPGSAAKNRKAFARSASYGRNLGTTIGLGFVGVSILSATAVFALKKNAPALPPKEIIREMPVVYRDRYLPAPATNKGTDPGQKAESKVNLLADARVPSTPSKPVIQAPAIGVPAVAKDEKKPPEKKLDEDLPMTGSNVEPGFDTGDSMMLSRLPAMKEIGRLKRSFVSKYDFDGYAKAIKNSSIAKEMPNIDALMRHISLLQQMRTIVDAGLAATNPSNPIKVSVPVGPSIGNLEVWGAGPGAVWVKKSNGDTSQMQISDLSPAQFRFLAQTISSKSVKPRETKPLMSAFDQEFRGQLRGLNPLKKQKGPTAQVNPFVSG